jgi:hypothetical protein
VKTVLIVSPHFPPVNAPDHQRVCMALPYLEQFGRIANFWAIPRGHSSRSLLSNNA